MFRMLWKKKVAIVLVILIVITLPVAITRPAQMLNKAVFTTIGIEKENDMYTITGEVIVNQFNEFGAKFIEITSGSGENINEAINKISQIRGRTMSLAHCSLIILGKGMEGEDISQLLTFFLHRTEISSNCSLLWTSAPMEELLTLSKEAADNRTNHLQQIADFNRKNQFGEPATLKQFFKDYFRLSKTSMIPIVSIHADAIYNPNTIAVFEDGKYTFSISDEEATFLAFLNRRASRKQISIEDVEVDGKTYRAVAEVQVNRHRIRTRLDNNVPTVRIRVRTRLKIMDMTPHTFVDLKSPDMPARQIATAFEKDLIAGLTKSLALIPENGTDFMQFTDRFWQMHRYTGDITDHLAFEFNVKARVVN